MKQQNNHRSNYILKYGVDSQSQLIHIDSPSLLNGKECNVVCPKCGDKLIAKKNGRKIAHHFAHFGDTICSGLGETLTHLLAKQVFKKSRKLLLPPMFLDKSFKNEDNETKLITFEKVIPEEEYSQSNISFKSFKPDAVAIFNNKTYLIEFVVSHKIDEDKKQKIKQSKLICIEIILNQNLNDEVSIQSIFEKETDCKKWISNPILEERYEQYKLNCIKEQEKYIQTLAKQSEANINAETNEFISQLTKTNNLPTQIINANTDKYTDIIQHINYNQAYTDIIYKAISSGSIHNTTLIAWLFKIGYYPYHFTDHFESELSCGKIENKEFIMYLLTSIDKDCDISIFETIITFEKIFNIIGCLEYKHIFFGEVPNWKAFINSNRKAINTRDQWYLIDIALDEIKTDKQQSMREFLITQYKGINCNPVQTVNNNDDLLKQALCIVFPEIFRDRI